jgi:hypothetical protein
LPDLTKPCPICKQPAALPAMNRWFPFCSNRCKTIDLGKWLNEEYRVPSGDDEPPPPTDDELVH